MKTRSARASKGAEAVLDDSDLAIVECRFDLERDLVSWLEGQSKLHHTSPSMLVTSLLEWARDEHILESENEERPRPSPGRSRAHRSHIEV